MALIWLTLIAIFAWAALFLWFCGLSEPRTTGQVIDVMEAIAPVGKWLAGINGIGLITAEGLQIAAYTAPITASDSRCVATHYSLIYARAGNLMAGLFLCGGIAALLVVLWPMAIKRFSTLRGQIKSVNAQYFLLLQITITLLAFMLPALIVINLIFLYKPTQEGIMNDWTEFDRQCNRPAAPLQVNIPIYGWL